MSTDPLDIVLPDTQLDRARRALKTCERKLAEQTGHLDRFYYLMCIKGWREWIAKLEAQQN